MSNPFELLEARLLNIETLLLDIKHLPQATENKLYSVKELAEYAGVSELTVRNWIIEGKVKAKKIGRRLFIEQSQFEKGLSEVKSFKYKR
jgi:excisionase family DNA binding protein